MSDSAPATEVSALLDEAFRSVARGDRATAMALLDEASSRELPEGVRVQLALARVNAHLLLQEPDLAAAALQEVRACHDPAVKGRVELLRSRVLLQRRDLEGAAVCAWSARLLCLEAGDQQGLVKAQLTAGAVAWRLGEHGRASVVLAEALAGAARLGDEPMRIHCLVELGFAELRRSRFTEARQAFAEAERCSIPAFPLHQRNALQGLFFTALERGDVVEAEWAMARHATIVAVRPTTHLMRGALCRLHGDWTGAKAAWSADPPEAEGLLELAILTGDLPAAEAAQALRQQRPPRAPAFPWLEFGLAALRGDVAGFLQQGRAGSGWAGATAAGVAVACADLWRARGRDDLTVAALRIGLKAATHAGAERTASAARDRLRDLPPSTPVPLGRWSLRARLGLGGFGEVWSADAPEGSVAAVKILRTDLASSRERTAVFRAEIQMVSSLDHPAIVRVFESGEVDEIAEHLSRGALATRSPWLAMQRMEGTLEEWCGRLRWPDVMRCLARVLAGLGHAHARGVLHRDLKLGNVLVRGDPADSAAIADFGLATTEVRGAAPAGTPGFMAPEQAEGRWRDLGPWTDLYGLGHMARLLVGDRVAVPAGFDGWLARLVAHDIRSRFQHAVDAREALEALAAPVLDRVRTAVSVDPEPPSSSTYHASEQPDGPAQAPPGPAHRSTGAPIGREAALATLEAAFDRVAGGGSQVVHVRGPAGVGKSFLVEVFATSLVERGRATRILPPRNRWGLRARPGDLLASALRTEGLAGDGLAAQLRTRLGDSAMQLDLREAARLLAAPQTGGVGPADHVAWNLLGLSADRPWLVVLDDPEDPDGPVEDARILGRVGAAGHALVLLVTDDGVPAVEGAEDVRMEPLAAEVMERWLREVHGLEASSAQRLATRSEGNPQLVLGWLESLRAADQLRPGPDGYVLRLPVGGDLPAVGEVWSRRLATLQAELSPDDTRALELAAITGARFRRSVWERACELDGCTPRSEVVDGWLTKGTLTERAGFLSFGAPAIRHLLSSQAESKGRALRLHALLAEVLEGGGDGLERGRHLMQAGRLEAATTVLCEHARGLADREPRELLLTLDVLLSGGAQLPTDLSLARVEALHQTGAATAAAKLAEALAPSLTTASDRLHLLFRWTLALRKGERFAEAVRIHEAHDELWSQLSVTEQVRFERSFAIVLFYAGERSRALTRLRAACDRLTEGAADPLRLELVDQLLQANRTEDAEQTLSRVADGPGRDAHQYWTTRGALLRAQGRLDESERAYLLARSGTEGLSPTRELVLRVNLVLLDQARGRAGVVSRLRELSATARFMGLTLTLAVIGVALASELAPSADEGEWTHLLSDLDRAMPSALDRDAVACLELGAERCVAAGHDARGSALLVRADALRVRLGMPPLAPEGPPTAPR